VSDSQVRYLWHNLASRIWLRDKKNPLLSANLYANEVDRVKCLHLTCPGYEGLLIINKVATSNLSRPGLVQELVMDATYGTNSAAYSLFAILAEVDGTGIPLAYAFTKPIAEKARNTGAPLMEMLHQVLRNIREEGFYPAVFHCDKDNAEIKAITSIFPIARVQLCYWHVLRAIRSKLKSSTSTVGHLYDPQEAKNVIPELEICWGSRIDRRSTGHRPTDHCLCPSRNSRYTSPGRLEPSTVTERDAVLNLIHRHFTITRSFLSKVVSKEMLPQYEQCVHQKCTHSVVRGIGGGHGLIFGVNGTSQQNGYFGRDRLITSCRSSKQQWCWRAIGGSSNRTTCTSITAQEWI